jgi:outer membrane protein assembly factor BamD (BamD/ComL family)
LTLARLALGFLALWLLAGVAHSQQRPAETLPAPQGPALTQPANGTSTQNTTPAREFVPPDRTKEAEEGRQPVGTWTPTPDGLKFEPYEEFEADEKSSEPTWVERFSPAKIFGSAKHGAKRVTGTLPNEDKARTAFQDAEKAFHNKDYASAAKSFKKASKLWPDSSLEEDALFMQAESLFFSDQYPKAHDTYDRLLKKYENSRYLDTAVHRQFAIGKYWLELQRSNPNWVLTPNMIDKTRPMFDTGGNALQAYEAVRLNDPTGPLADDSIMATANAHFVDDSYEEADYFYTMLRRDYPHSDFQADAHLLGLRSKLLKYQGPHYDGAPLDEAKDLVRQTLVQFPEELKEERERLLQAQRAVVAQLAQREFERAQFYDNTKYYRAARHHYSEVVKEYPGSKFAELATARLAEIKNLPDVPKQRLSWLANLFPGENKKRR